MSAIIRDVVHAVWSAIAKPRELVLENIALKHQLEVVLRPARPRPRLKLSDRVLWVWLSRSWSGWKDSLRIVQPETVIAWHRRGGRRYWTGRSRRRGPGRPLVAQDVRDLLRRLSSENATWGAPRLHGELLQLGIDVSPATVAKYMVRHEKPPSPNWRTFLDHHATSLASVDFFTVPTVRNRILYLFGDRFRDHVTAMGINEVLTAPQSPWQSPYVERLIGSIRRECLDHVIVCDEAHLRRVLREYLDGYYHPTRTHLGLGGDAPIPRPVQPREMGQVVAFPIRGGLHHRYERRAA
jgi:putative transposase